jgi:hypothetical protein
MKTMVSCKVKALKCPLCELNLRKEKIFHEDATFIVLRTENLKGHRERIMMVSKEHVHTIPHKVYERGLDILSKISREVFSYTPKAVIMDSTFATINDHWHLVATDLDPKGEDFQQILVTRWVSVVDNTIDSGK